MDRSREARRVTMAASANGLPSRRRQRSSLRDSPEEDGPVELHEPARLRDRGLKKERDRDRDRLSRSKRRRNRVDGGDDSSEESVNDEEEDDEEDGSGGAAAVRSLPPNPAAVLSNHHYQQHVSRRNFPPSAVFNDNKVFRPVQGMKPADEMIGFSFPRKARSASTKRAHESWISGTGAGAEQINRQASPSLSPAPLSPSSSNVPLRKKMKPNGPKHKPPKSSSNASSSNPEELEIEIAEVLFGLMTQSQPPSKKDVDSAKFDSNRQSTDTKSRVSSPNSNSASASASASASTSGAPQSSSLLPQNSSSSTAPLSAVAPKRKKPRQVSDNQGCFNASDGPISSTTVKLEMNQSPKVANLELTRAENGDMQSLPPDFTGSRMGFLSSEPSQSPGLGAELPTKEQQPVVDTLSKSEPLVVKPGDNHDDSTPSKVNSASSEMGIQRGEKFEINLMAPPPELRSSPKRESKNVDSAAFSEHKPSVESKADTDMKAMITQDKSEKSSESDGDETMVEKSELKKWKATSESHEREKSNGILPKKINIDLQLNLEKPGTDNPESPLLSGDKSHPQVQKPRQPQLKVSKDEHPQTEKPAQPSSLPLPMSLASWPGGLPPMGYMAPLQGVVSMNGSQVPTTPVQWSFSQPRSKRCATHCYIARNIQYLQQYMKMNPFWPAATVGSASLFGVKPCNLNVGTSAELPGGTVNSVVHKSKGQGLAIFPGNVGKDKDASQPAASIADAQRKQQQILLQQALPPGAPQSNIMGPAFIFPFNQQQAAAAATAAASVRSGPMAKSPNAAPSPATASASTSASANGSAAAAPTAAAVSFNYPNFPSSETQYLAILQNNAYPYPIPPPTYRGTHPQPMPFFNSSFYTPQMIHPPQLQQSSSQPQQIQQGLQNTSISSGSSPSQKQHHLQSQQQRPQGPGVNGGSGTGSSNTFPTLKAQATQSSQPHQARNLETVIGREDSPSTADSSRVSCGTVNVYGHNFAMPIHHQNFALVSSAPPLAGSSNGNNNQSENKQPQQLQQQGLKPGADSLPQTFAMSFSSISGGGSTPGIGLSSIAQNHTVLQNLPEAARHNYQIMQAAAAAQAAQQRKNFKVSEEGKNGGGGDSSSKDEEKKGLTGKSSVPSGQSIAFSRPDSTDPLVSSLTGTNVIDSSARSLNLVSTPHRGSRASISNAMGAVNSTSSQLQNQMQFQQQHMQQQMVQLQKQQQQQLQQQMAAARNKTPPTSSGSVYSGHLASSSPSATSKFPNAISSLTQNLVQNGVGSGPSQSSQWKSTARTDSQAQVSTMSSLKNLSQQQTRPQQSHTQISFGSSLKPQTALQGQQGPITHQSSSPPTGVSSPTASLSKSATGSPRTPSSHSQGNKAAYCQPSSLSSQQSKNVASMPCLKSPSILGNPLNITSSNNVTKSHLQQQQQQLKQMAASQPQLFFSPAYMRTQSPHLMGATSNSPTTATSGYYLQRHYPEKQQQQQGLPSTTSTGMLSLCAPLTQTSTSSSDAKTVAASVSNLKGGGLPSQSVVHQSQFTAQSLGSFSFVHTVPAAVQVKPTEQKQPAGNRDSLTRK